MCTVPLDSKESYMVALRDRIFFPVIHLTNKRLLWMTSYFMSLWSTAQVTGLTCIFTLNCAISQDAFWPNSGAWRRSWLAYSAWQSGVCRNMRTTSKSEVCKVFLKRQRKPLQVRFSSDARAGQAGVPGSSVGSALSACKLCSQKPPFAPEFARGS